MRLVILATQCSQCSWDTNGLIAAGGSDWGALPPRRLPAEPLAPRFARPLPGLLCACLVCSRQRNTLRQPHAQQRGVQVWTVDHEDGGRQRLDLEFGWTDTPVPQTPKDEIVCDVSAGYVCAQDACSVLWHENLRWWTISADALLALQDGMLLEYDMHTFAPVGAHLLLQAQVLCACTQRWAQCNQLRWYGCPDV